MNFYQPVSRDDQKGCSLPKTAATIKNKTEKDLAPIIDIKQTSKEVLSQIHFFRFTYKLAQRINKNQSNELELKNSLTDNMFNLVLIKID